MVRFLDVGDKCGAAGFGTDEVSRTTRARDLCRAGARMRVRRGFTWHPGYSGANRVRHPRPWAWPEAVGRVERVGGGFQATGWGSARNGELNKSGEWPSRPWHRLSRLICGTAVCKPCWIILLSFVERDGRSGYDCRSLARVESVDNHARVSFGRPGKPTVGRSGAL